MAKMAGIYIGTEASCKRGARECLNLQLAAVDPLWIRIHCRVPVLTFTWEGSECAVHV